MQTTDEDPNINEDDKQASIDEASTQLSGNTCIVSDNFKAGNPCSRWLNSKRLKAFWILLKINKTNKI